MTFKYSMLLISCISLVCGCKEGPRTSTIRVEQDILAKNEPDQRVSLGWCNLYGPDYLSVSREVDLQLDFRHQSPIERWRLPIGKGYSAPVVKSGKLVLLSRYGDQEKVECRKAESGDLLWSHEYPTEFECKFEYSNGPYATPVLNDEVAITVGAEGLFHCFDLSDGSVRWTRNPLFEHEVDLKEWPVTTSPLLLEERIIFNLGDKQNQAGVIAMDVNSGETIWESTSEDFSHASPVPAAIGEEQFVLVMADSGLLCLSPEDGSVYWEIPHRIRQLDRYNAVSPAVSGNKVCFVTGPSVKPGFRCIEISPNGSYTEPWKNIRLLNSQYTNLVIVDSFLYGFTPVKQGGPELVCIDLEKGKKAWKARPGIGRGNLLAVQDRMLILGEEGVLTVMELNGSEFKECFKTKTPILSKPCYTSMALSDGLLFARNEKEIVCLTLRSAEYSK